MSTTHATTSRNTSSKKPTLTKSGSRGKSTSGSFVTPEQRRQMIEEAAYFLAEHRGFCEGDTQADWFCAESQIDQMLTKG